VIVDQVNVEHTARVESENDTPVAGNIDRIVTSTCAFELMKPVAWPAQVLNRTRCVKVGENQFDPLDTRGADAAAIATFKEAFKAPMPETDDHG